MKYLSKAKKILKGMGVLIFFLSLSPKISFALPRGVDINDCTVQDPSGGSNGRRSVTLRQAINYANRTDNRSRYCRNSITVSNVPEIGFSEPLVIAVTASTGTFTLKGNNTDGSRVVLNFANVTAPQPVDPTKNCVLVFDSDTANVHNILLQGIAIKNAPAGMSGICLKRANSITLDYVQITQTSGGGHGIVVSETAKDITINSNSELSHIDGSALYNLHSSELANNGDELANIVLNGTSRLSSGTDGNGTATFPGNDSEAKDLSLSDIGGNFVHSEAPDKVLISEANTTSTEGQYLIRGAVVKDDVRYIPQFPEADSSFQAHLEQRLTRIQVYAVGTVTGQNVIQNPEVFLTYVTPQSACVDQANCQYGLEGSSNGVGSAGNFSGIFSFRLDTSSILTRINQNRTGDNRITAVNRIILLPELANGSIASSSRVIELIGGYTQTDVDPSAVQNGGGGGNGYQLTGAMTLQQCMFVTSGGTRPAPPVFDSDGDGIPDYLEDLNHNCICDDNEFSCWNDPDSDQDGILDFNELNGGQINPGRFHDGAIDNTMNFCTGGTGTVDPCDVNGNHVSNARDHDSDGDSLPDVQEDRARMFSGSAKAYYYTWDSSSGSRQAYLSGGNRVECTNALIASQRQTIGAMYGVYRVKKDHSGNPVAYNYEGTVGSDEEVIRLACINDSAGLTSFNGRYDGRESGETPIYSTTHTDTLGNSVNDRECKGTQLMVNGRTVCQLDCNDREIFSLLPAQYVTPDGLDLVKDDHGMPVLYNDYKDRYQELLALCPDIDGDGIPSCVESDTASCSRMPTLPSGSGGSGSSTAGGQNLNPYRKDTDGDSFVDGIAQVGEIPDLCPFTNDGDNNNGSSCLKARIYVSRPILACFLDRDQDGLTDCQEDLNRDGIVDKVGGMDLAQAGRLPTGSDPRLITETDPLSSDTDNDGVSDFVEVQTWRRYTNPAWADTDGDGLPDGLEVKDYSAGPSGTYRTSGIAPEGACKGFAMIPPSTTDLIAYGSGDANAPRRLGTDPANPDTDGDGIKDGTEVTGTIDGKIPQADLVAGLVTGFDVVSDPLSDDSDGDGVKDADEYGTDSIMDHTESNPCDQDTDTDSVRDSLEKKGCAANPSGTCVENSSGFLDGDGDGEPDWAEAMLGTDPTKPDSDLDGLLDGQEDINHDGRIDFSAGETNPTCQVLSGETPPDANHADPTCAGKDTDSDGLLDSTERVLGTNPAIADTDGDGIIDGIEMHFRQSPTITGDDTDPRNPDTDGDGLCDGGNNVTKGGPNGDVTCIRGEDLNNNGIRDLDPRNANRFIETDPRSADSDGDGQPDKEEACRGGQCLTADNELAANSGSNQGCFSLSAATSPIDPSSMLWIYGLMLAMNRLFAKRVKMWTRKK